MSLDAIEDQGNTVERNEILERRRLLEGVNDGLQSFAAFLVTKATEHHK